MQHSNDHWLIAAARRAGLDIGSGLQIHPRLALDDAWLQVAGACGLTDRELARKVAPTVGMKVAELAIVEDSIAKLLPERVARQFRVLPVRTQHNVLVVATSDPGDLDAERAVGFCAGRRVLFELAAPSQLAAAIDAMYAPDRLTERLLTATRSELTDAIKLIQTVAPTAITAQEADKAPVVRLANLILLDAIAAGASDVHIEPEVNGGLVRVRVDGVMQDYMSLPRPVLDRLVSRLKIMSDMDVSDRLRPHSGRAQIEADGVTYDLRVSTVPTRHSEKAVVRLLRPGKSQTLADLRLPGSAVESLRELFGYKDGLVVVTGPTGSGKTTLLYAALRELATGQINLMTVEDPVEYEFSGVTQIQVAPRQGLTFASIVRTILRQDPDVILIGEIRDLETAEIALQAAMTGHFVLTTLHTIDAAGVIPRLTGLGVNKASIAGSLRGVVAQRLVRLSCSTCRGTGCSACRNTGFRGRVPIVEILRNTAAMERAITDNASVQVLNRIAHDDGMESLHGAALQRIRAGETTADEVERVLGKPRSDDAKAVAALPPHILVVASDPGIRRTLRSVLEKHDWRVSEAASGGAAIERAEEPNDFALAVIDMDMPGMDGRALLVRLRSATSTLALPALLLVPPASTDLVPALLELGADDCISKPLDANSLAHRVRGCLRRVGAAGGPEVAAELSTLLEESWPSIAVLPFADMSPSRDQQYLCDGLAEELIGALAKLDGLRVASRTSSFRIRDAGLDLRDIGKQLGVATILEGSVQKDGDRLRISTHLINVDDGYDLWSERYERSAHDVFDLQDLISRSVVGKLRVVLLGRPEVAAVQAATSDREAYDAYLKGRFHWNQRTEDGLHRAVGLFRDAIRHDANFALAHAGLADANVTLALYGAVAPSEVMPVAMRAADRALALDDTSAEALTGRGCVRALYLWDEDADVDFKRAIELAPANAKAHHWYAANYLLPQGRFVEARSAIAVAIRLEPLSPSVHATMGVVLHFERRFEEAIDHLKRTVALDASFGFAPFFIGQAQSALSQHDAAIKSLTLAANLSGGSPEVLASLAYAHAIAGHASEAQKGMDALLRLTAQRYVSPVLLSQVALGLGERDRALGYLKKGLEVRATDLAWIGVRPVFDAIRSEPAFLEVSSHVLCAQH